MNSGEAAPARLSDAHEGGTARDAVVAATNTEMSTIMTTETLNLGFAPGAAATSSEAKPSLLTRIFEHLARGRQRQAEAHVDYMLSTMTDRQLADAGFSPGRVARIRAAARTNAGPGVY